MSASPVPTSSSVADAPSRGNTARASSTAARSPPSQRFDRVTSPIDRSRTAESVAGSSRISTPRRRDGVSTLWSSLQLRVPAAVVEQRLAVEGLGPIDFGDEHRVIARVVVLKYVALEVRERVVEQHDAIFTARIRDPVEALRLRIRESPGVRFLFR